MNWDPVATFTLVLSAAICAVGIVGWARVRNALALYIGLAFGLFALSHGTMILGRPSRSKLCSSCCTPWATF